MSLYKGTNLISGHQVLYSTTGNNTDGAMTQDATTNALNGKVDLDYSNADYQPVNKTGDTMSGSLQILSPVPPQIVIQNTEQVAGTTPTSEEQQTRLSFHDSNGTMVGYVQNVYNTDGSRVSMLDSRNADGTTHTSIVVGYDASGSAYSSFPNTTCCDGQWVNKTTQIMNGVSLNGSTVLTYTLNDLPNDGKSYWVWFTASVTTGSTSGNLLTLKIYSDVVSSNFQICGARTRAAATVGSAGSIMIPVSSSRKIYILRDTDYTGTASLWLKGYRRRGTNS